MGMVPIPPSVPTRTPIILSSSAVPIGMPPNGTVATNGTITLNTGGGSIAFDTTYSGGIWLRLPAGAVSGGSAGLYWCVMSSTTVGTVYTNFQDPASEFVPYIPTGTLTAATGSNSAYTQTTAADLTVLNKTMPARSMGPNGFLKNLVRVSMSNSANTKVLSSKFGSAFLLNNQLTTQRTFGYSTTTYNRGVENRQISPAFGSDVSSGAVSVYSSIDTSAAVSLLILLKLVTAGTDWIVLESNEYQYAYGA